MTKRNRAYKFRIYPNKKQKDFFEKSFNCSDFIYNYFLSRQKEIEDILRIYSDVSEKELKEFRKKHGIYFNKFEASREATQIRNTTHQFLKEVDSTSRTYALEFLDKAFSNMSKIKSRYPRFKRKHNSLRSFSGQCSYSKEKLVAFSIEPSENGWYKINIPKLKGLKTRIHNPEFVDQYRDKEAFKLNNYTVSKNASGQYFISIQVAQLYPSVKQKEVEEKTSIGIDLGVKRLITTSEEGHFDIELFKGDTVSVEMLEEDKKRLEAILSKKRINNKSWKESKKYDRLKNKIAKISNKITNKRKDLQHNITSKLVNLDGVDTFVFEDINVSKMLQKKDKKSTNRTNKNNNKSLAESGLGSIRDKVKYKAEWLGKNIVFVNPAYTSQKCNQCGYVDSKNRVSQHEFHCVNCGHEDNADLNAAKNIKEKYFSEIYEKC